MLPLYMTLPDDGKGMPFEAANDVPAALNHDHTKARNTDGAHEMWPYQDGQHPRQILRKPTRGTDSAACSWPAYR